MRRGGWRWLGCALVPVLAGCSALHGPDAPTSADSTGTAPPSAPASSPAIASAQDPVRLASQVITHAREARVDPQLVMAILYNESYKPHDPTLERAWQQLHPYAAFGIANMHRAAFDETKKGRAFAGRQWEQLPDDPDLAIQAESWYLHDLAAQLPADHTTRSTTDELLALGYNAGPGNMKTFAHGTPPGPQAQSYLDNLHRNWTAAGQAIAKG